MIVPRALLGPVRAMARPGRPRAERIAVIEAAALVRGEMRVSSGTAVAGEIAKRVVAAFFADLERGDDPLGRAFAELEQKLAENPIATLATCADIDTAQHFVDQRIARLRARGGRFLTQSEQEAERRAMVPEMAGLLSARYLRHLRSSDG